MSFEDTRTNIETLLANRLDPTVPIIWENTPQNDPNNPLWIRASIRPASTTRLEMGCDSKRTIGIVFIQIFTLAESGTREIEALRDELSEFLTSTRNSEIEFRETTHGFVGYQEPWYRVDFQAEYQIDF